MPRVKKFALVLWQCDYTTDVLLPLSKFPKKCSQEVGDVADLSWKKVGGKVAKYSAEILKIGCKLYIDFLFLLNCF